MTSEEGSGNHRTRLDGWCEWLERDLFQQVHQLMRQREIFRSWNDIVEIVDSTSAPHGLFHRWVTHNYVDSLAVGVRRMCDQDSRTRSLVRLLTEIAEHSAELTREWWADRWTPAGESPPDHYLARFDAWSSGGDHVDLAVVEAGLAVLARVNELVGAYVDKYVAHVDGDRGTLDPVTLGELHNAVDEVYTVFHRWYQLISNEVLAAPLVEPWESAFADPWITADAASVIVTRRQVESQELKSRLSTGR